MNPTGKVDKPTKPIPVRLFEAKLQKLNVAETEQESDVAKSTVQKLRDDISKLPQNNVVILDV